METESAPAPRPQAEPAHLGWRLLAIVYDALPVIALWFVVGAIVLLVRGGTPVVPWSIAWWLQNGLLWAVTGAYFTWSWRRGGQTLGMRPWRLVVVDDDGHSPPTPQLWKRYAWATVSLASLGLGFVWSLIERERRTLHDVASGTRLVRLPKKP
jgi:uncharacterized RDD family membrane protein YckC